MTLLTKPITRELLESFDRRQWIIELQPLGVNFRAKKTRRVYPVTWSQIWNKAMLNEVVRAKAEKAERRKQASRG